MCVSEQFGQQHLLREQNVCCCELQTAEIDLMRASCEVEVRFNYQLQR